MVTINELAKEDAVVQHISRNFYFLKEIYPARMHLAFAQIKDQEGKSGQEENYRIVERIAIEGFGHNIADVAASVELGDPGKRVVYTTLRDFAERFPELISRSTH